MPRQPQNEYAGFSPHSSTRNNESALPHVRSTRASCRNATKNSSTPAFPVLTDGRTSGGDHIFRPTGRDPASTADRLVDLCNECECYLRPEEKEANERDVTA